MWALDDNCIYTKEYIDGKKQVTASNTEFKPRNESFKIFIIHEDNDNTAAIGFYDYIDKTEAAAETDIQYEITVDRENGDSYSVGGFQRKGSNLMYITGSDANIMYQLLDGGGRLDFVIKETDHVAFQFIYSLYAFSVDTSNFSKLWNLLN